jgi:hypothetical protein
VSLLIFVGDRPGIAAAPPLFGRFARFFARFFGGGFGAGGGGSSSNNKLWHSVSPLASQTDGLRSSGL